jgi:hypothetical protein
MGPYSEEELIRELRKGYYFEKDEVLVDGKKWVPITELSKIEEAIPYLLKKTEIPEIQKPKEIPSKTKDSKLVGENEKPVSFYTKRLPKQKAQQVQSSQAQEEKVAKKGSTSKELLQAVPQSDSSQPSKKQFENQHEEKNEVLKKRANGFLQFALLIFIIGTLFSWGSFFLTIEMNTLDLGRIQEPETRAAYSLGLFFGMSMIPMSITFITYVITLVMFPQKFQVIADNLFEECGVALFFGGAIFFFSFVIIPSSKFEEWNTVGGFLGFWIFWVWINFKLYPPPGRQSR